MTKLGMSRCLFAFTIAGMLVVGQPRLQFEVASVKPGAPIPFGDNININLGTVRNGMLTLTNATLNDCLRFAYEITSDQQIAGPDWMHDKSQRYDIIAKALPETPRTEMLSMLQALLTERFQIRMHREPRELNYYAFVPAKKGVKIEPSKEGGAGPNERNGGGHIIRRQISMTMLATLLARFELHGIVLDQTGLKGTYSVDLEWTPANAPADAAPGPSLFTAVQEQLGLRLEARKGPVEVMVIDSALKVPVEN